MNSGNGDGSGIRNTFFSNANGVDTSRMGKASGSNGGAAEGGGMANTSFPNGGEGEGAGIERSNSDGSEGVLDMLGVSNWVLGSSEEERRESREEKWS